MLHTYSVVIKVILIGIVMVYCFTLIHAADVLNVITNRSHQINDGGMHLCQKFLMVIESNQCFILIGLALLMKK